MLAINGYYDGINIKPLDDIVAKPNQKVIITIIDEFIEPEKKQDKKSMRGVLSAYASPDLARKEKGAWERAVVEKYANL